MPVFKYKGRTGRGESVSGTLEAEDADAVARQLFNTGITPIDINESEEKRRGAGVQLQLWRPRPKSEDLILFTRQMYSLTKAGVPLIRGLRGLIESTRNEILAEALEDVVDALESGRDLSGALARHANIFGPLYINIVRVGENSGNLEESFLRLGQYLQLDRETRRKVKSALMYPSMVIGAIVIAIAIVTIWVIPQFSRMFAAFDAELPLATRGILAVSNFAQAWWPWLLVAAVLGATAFSYWSKTPKGSRTWDRWKLRIPAVGDIILRATLARFARTFAMCFRAGVPLVQALTLVSRALDNNWLGDRVAGMRNGVERGESLHRTARAAGIFTPLVLQMIQVGEETGSVDDMLEEAADFYEREVQYDIDNLSAIIEPILIVFVGILVLLLALGIFLPMWDLARVAM
ncbi:type II secretion system F family protein [Natronospira bacteriovora]|uniref:Type II secretion system F family protein n=1 Tax=Natronospira bacteriovora TaxID=3069753 RepID=A0ABU0W776_9GAMM|nr:type II secretion system F family protein [Natronospira sp. AB-CW4]MDQ2069881.1 type II secretion system F family protein [Natronospira sp. AB-CW4]